MTTKPKAKANELQARENPTSGQGLRADSPVFIPVLPLMLRRTIFDEFALAASLSRYPPIGEVDTDLRPLAAPRRVRAGLFVETNITINPVAHLLRRDPPVSPLSLDL